MKTRRRLIRSVTAAVALFAMAAPFSATLHAEEKGPREGSVQVPLSVYEDLVARLRATQAQPRPAPAAYAFGKATVSINVRDDGGVPSARVQLQVPVRTFESEWTGVVVLAGGTAVQESTVDGQPVTLVHGPQGLMWATDKAGSYNLQLTYQVDAQHSDGGWVLAVPLAPGAAVSLSGSVPGSGLDLTVVPAVGAKVTSSGDRTSVQASLPPTAAVQLSWRTGAKEGHVISRATYNGQLTGDAVTWTARYEVELYSADALTLPLLPRAVTLRDLSVDGKQATVFVEGDRFATTLKGRGNHEVEVRFQVAVGHGEGPPQIQLQVPEVPVSRFELKLQGKKDITVRPAASVESRQSDSETVATAYVPLTSSVVFTWSEAIPEDLQALVRANASIYHAAHAEEGVLHVRAMIVYEVTRGETNIFTLEVPADVQINRIVAKSGSVSDWRVIAAEPNQPRLVNVFLDRKVKGEYTFDVYYERLLGAELKDATLPLLRAAEVHRQRGMIALLKGNELALNPEREVGLSKVGENQLPAFVREALDMTIAHTYKYITDDPVLVVKAVAPERKVGKFDAQVDTLISIGEVTMKGSATVEVNVKSGSLMEIVLELPEDVNVLGLTGPSLRTHSVKSEGGKHRIEVPFTQEMEGQFRLEVSYERILSDAEADVQVPTVAVLGAEVEHGRIAVEALTAVEVQAAKADQLSTVDVNELPQQLVLKTTNPILLAYKYVHVEPPFQLILKVTRHEELEVQQAAIDKALYSTLFTRDGLSVTRALFTVRNSRKQFLKVELPAESEVWSVFVAGKAEKPARATGTEASDKNSVLIKLINSVDGFDVEMVYATQLPAVGSIGVLESHLPRPHDMVVTHTRWDIYLPASKDVHWKEPDSNMDLLQAAGEVSTDAFERSVNQGDVQAVQPLRLQMPTTGLLYSFEKVYANQSEEHAWVHIPYTSAEGERWSRGLSLLGAVLLWIGVFATVQPRRWPLPVSVGMSAVGLVLLVLTIGWFGGSGRPALNLSVVMLLLFFAWRLRGVVMERLGRIGGGRFDRDQPSDNDEPPTDGHGGA